MIVVDPNVTRLKFEREFELWRENAETYRRRGWILLGHRELEVDIGSLGRLPLGPQPMPAMSACVRIDFTNYDLWPPSVEFINPLTGEYAPPPVQALVDSDEGPRNLVVQMHPDTNRPKWPRSLPVLGAALVPFGWLSVLPRSDLALREHGLMMPAMLVPMFLRLNLYTSRHSHHRAAACAARHAR